MEGALTQRVALVTGGARGIGRAIGLDLAAGGWSVAVCYRTSRDDGESFVRAANESGGKGLALECDVSDPDACEGLVERVRSELGPIEVLVNAAGPYHRAPLMKETVEGWREMFDHNLHPVFFLSRLVSADMIELGRGRILNFAMANADRMVAQPMVTAHYIAKSGVLILTRTLAKVLGKHGVTVNAISPGFLDSGSAPPEELEPMVKNIPAGYLGELKDAVAAARYLLSDDARYVNGANIQLSGGWGV